MPLAVAALSLIAPAPGWIHAARGPAGGTVWAGRIPNTYARWDRRQSAIYLPPGYDPHRRYPVAPDRASRCRGMGGRLGGLPHR